MTVHFPGTIIDENAKTDENVSIMYPRILLQFFTIVSWH